MSTIIKFTLRELQELIDNENSCICKKTVTQNIELQPWCLSNIKSSLEKILDYRIGKFDKNLDGIVLSYKNVKILNDLCAIRQDSAEINSDVQMDLFLFRPHVGAVLCGVVNKKSVTHIGLLVHRVFNVVIPRPTDCPGQSWPGESLTLGQEVLFRIAVMDLFGALPYIRGCLDESLLLSNEDNYDGVKSTNASESDEISDVDDHSLQLQEKLVKNAMEVNIKRNKAENQVWSLHKKSEKQEQLPVKSLLETNLIQLSFNNLSAVKSKNTASVPQPQIFSSTPKHNAEKKSGSIQNITPVYSEEKAAPKKPKTMKITTTNSKKVFRSNSSENSSDSSDSGGAPDTDILSFQNNLIQKMISSKASGGVSPGSSHEKETSLPYRVSDKHSKNIQCKNNSSLLDLDQKISHSKAIIKAVNTPHVVYSDHSKSSSGSFKSKIEDEISKQKRKREDVDYANGNNENHSENKQKKKKLK